MMKYGLRSCLPLTLLPLLACMACDGLGDGMDVLDVEGCFVTRQGDDVEAYREVESEFPQVGVCRIDDAPYLPFAYGFLWKSVVQVLAGLYLNYYQFAVFFGYQVQFLLPGTPVAVADDIALCLQVGGCLVFPVFP